MSARARDEVAEDADLELLIDQAFGVLWYRVLFEHDPLTPAAVGRLADSLVRSAGRR